MNNIYRVIWNKSTQTFQAVCEFAKSQGKSSAGTVGSSSLPKFTTKVFTLTALTVGMMLSSSVWAQGEFGGVANEANSLAVGTGAKVGEVSGNGLQGVAIGNNAWAASEADNRNKNTAQNVAVGVNSEAVYGGVAIGYEASTFTNPGKSTWVGSDQVFSHGTAGNNQQSVAIGYQTIASGDQATALGAQARAEGNSSIAIGGDDLDKVASLNPPKYNVTGNTGALNNTFAAKKYKEITNDFLVHFDGSQARYVPTKAGEAAVAVGVQSRAEGALPTAFGTRTEASGTTSVALGVGSTATNEGSFAAAAGAKSTGKSSIAIGTAAQATNSAAIAVGDKASATTKDSIAIGANAVSNNMNGQTTADVTNANARRESASATTAVGAGANATGRNAVAIGAGAETTSGLVGGVNRGDNVAVGGGAKAAYGGVAQGFKTEAGDKSVTIGLNAGGTQTNAVSIGVHAGNDSNADTHGVAIGNGAGKTVKGTENVAIGHVAGNNVQGNTNYSMGSRTGQNVTGHDNFSALIEAGSNISGTNNIAMGKRAGRGNSDADRLVIDNTLSIGAWSRSNNNAIAVGMGTTATGVGSIAIGSSEDERVVSNDNDVTVVQNKAARTNGNYSVALGVNASTEGENAIAIGKGAQATAKDTISIGTGNVVSGQGSGAIGDPSVIQGTNSYSLGNNNAIGSASDNVLTLGGQNNVGATATRNGAGVITDTSTLTQTQNVDRAFVLGYKNTIAATADASDSVIIGNENTVNAQNTMVLGNKVTATAANNVILGNESSEDSATTTAGRANDIENGTVNGITYGSFAGMPVGVVSVGATGKERQIINVAAGKISADSTDAINGSQLYLTQDVLGNVAKTTKNIIGGETTLNPNTGELTANNIGDTNKNTVHDAIKAVKSTVVAGTNVTDVVATDNPDGSKVYTVNANGTTVSNGSDAVTVVAGTKDAKNVTDYKVDLSQASKDSLAKADTAVQELTTSVNGTQVETLNQNNKDINFVNGTGTTARAVGSDITFDVNKSA